MKQSTIDKLVKLAQEVVRQNKKDFMPDDYAGGNIDDAWYNGVDDGQRQLAREILNDEDIKFIIPDAESSDD